MGRFFSDVGSFIVSTVSSLSFFDIIDIALVSILIYILIKFIRDTRAAFLFKGILVVVALFAVSSSLNLAATNFILESFLEFGVLAIIIVFQPEIRSALEKMGRNGIKKIIPISFDEKNSAEGSTGEMISNLCKAVSHFSATKTGALIVIERNIKLGDIISSGKSIALDCDTTPELVMNIFFNKAPLHDGAVIIREGRVHSAGCFLPLSNSDDIIKDLGTRHRAAVGASEDSDAIIIVVSEQTGIISLAVKGELYRNFTSVSLRRKLGELLGMQRNAQQGNEELK